MEYVRNRLCEMSTLRGILIILFIIFGVDFVDIDIDQVDSMVVLFYGLIESLAPDQIKTKGDKNG